MDGDNPNSGGNGEDVSPDGLRKWMESGGRPLEMQVADAFMSVARSVEQSPFYTDPDEGKAREIDVVALLSPGRPQYVASAEIECKFNAPPFIIVLPSETRTMEFRCLSAHARRVMPKQPNLATEMGLVGSPLFDPYLVRGHSILTRPMKLKGKGDVGWEAAVAAVKAANHFATRLDGTDHPETHIAFPVVVTDGIVATAQLSYGELEVKEVNHAQLVLKRPIGDSPAVIVDVVRAKYIKRWAREWEKVSHILLRHMEQASTQ